MSTMNATDLLQEVELRRRLPTPARRRQIRRAAGVSRLRLANALGVSDVTVLRWERGTVDPSRTHIAAYVDLLEQLDAR